MWYKSRLKQKFFTFVKTIFVGFHNIIHDFAKLILSLFSFFVFSKKQSQKCEKITVSFEPHTHLPGQSARQTLKGIISSPGMVKKFVMPVFVSWDGIFKLLGRPGNRFLEIDSASLRSLRRYFKLLRSPVSEFIDPVLGVKMIVFAKTSQNRLFSI
jgi:hypothetical protein